MGIRWSVIKLVNCNTVEGSTGSLDGKKSKYVDKIILPVIDANKQPATQLIGGVDNWNFYLKEVGILLESDKFCAKFIPSIMPMAAHVLELCGDYASQDHKNIGRNIPLLLFKNNFEFEIFIKTSAYCPCHNAFKNLWLVIFFMHTHSYLIP